MNNNKKGLSTVVATLIIILLVLVAVGILWVVLQNVFNQGAQTISLSQKCLAVNVDVVSLAQTANNSGLYTLTMHRASGGDTIGGLKINFLNSTASSGIVIFNQTLAPLDTKTQVMDTSKGDGGNLTNANQMQYTVFFVDSLGNQQDCPSSGSKDIGKSA